VNNLCFLMMFIHCFPILAHNGLYYDLIAESKT
jgi:hypothetical protein